LIFGSLPYFYFRFRLYTATKTAVFALFLPVQPSDWYYVVQIDFLAANLVRIVGLCGQNGNRTHVYSFTLRSVKACVRNISNLRLYNYIRTVELVSHLSRQALCITATRQRSALEF